MTDSTLSTAEARALERATAPTITRILDGYTGYDPPERPLESLIAAVQLGVDHLPRGWHLSSSVSNSAPVAAWNAAYWNWEIGQGDREAVLLLFGRATAERLTLDLPPTADSTHDEGPSDERPASADRPPTHPTEEDWHEIGLRLRQMLLTEPTDQLVRRLEAEVGPASAGRDMCMLITWEALNLGATLEDVLILAEKAAKTFATSYLVKATWTGCAVLARTDPVEMQRLISILGADAKDGDAAGEQGRKE